MLLYQSLSKIYINQIKPGKLNITFQDVILPKKEMIVLKILESIYWIEKKKKLLSMINVKTCLTQFI